MNIRTLKYILLPSLTLALPLDIYAHCKATPLYKGQKYTGCKIKDGPRTFQYDANLPPRLCTSYCKSRDLVIQDLLEAQKEIQIKLESLSRASSPICEPTDPKLLVLKPSKSSEEIPAIPDSRVEEIDARDPLNTKNCKAKFSDIEEVTREITRWLQEKSATNGHKNILYGILDFIENIAEEENATGELFLLCDAQGDLYSAGVLRKAPSSIYLSFIGASTDPGKKGGGGGRAGIKYLIKRMIQERKDKIELHSAYDSKGFYYKMGFAEKTPASDDMILPRSAVTKKFPEFEGLL